MDQSRFGSVVDVSQNFLAGWCSPSLVELKVADATLTLVVDDSSEGMTKAVAMATILATSKARYLFEVCMTVQEMV